MISIKLTDGNTLEITQDNNIINVETWSDDNVKIENHQISTMDFVELIKYHKFVSRRQGMPAVQMVTDEEMSGVCLYYFRDSNNVYCNTSNDGTGTYVVRDK